MDLDKMLARCRREQWNLDDVRWDRPARAMSREMEMAIVQCFKDMAGIERLAAAIFTEQARRAHDPRLRQIFETFVEDELRHAEAAERLAAHYDVNKLRRYEPSAVLDEFARSFLDAVRYLPPDIANAYITFGEMVLDMALLSSLDDAVDDVTSSDVMKLVNRDESRHIAMDLYMFDYYGSDEYAQIRAAEASRSFGTTLSGSWTLCRLMRHARPFFRQVFFEPMTLVDPSGRRIKDAVKRLQLLIRRPSADGQPFVSFIRSLHDAYQHPVARALAGPAIVRLIGLEPELLQKLYSESELRRAAAMSLEELREGAPAA